jgi:hypothetical protein
MKTKTLNIEAMLKNINGLSKGDVAYCGPFGTVTCTESAKGSKSGVRKFKVSGSSRIRNGGNWTMSALREAVR